MVVKILPVLVAILLTLSNFLFTDKTEDNTERIKNPDNHLTRDVSSEPTTNVLSISEASSKSMTDNRRRVPSGEQTILRLTWNVVPYAVKYKITYEGKTVISYTTGIEIPVRSVNSEFIITALDFDSNIVEDNVEVVTAETDPVSPRITTEFDKMSAPPVYMVYSWIPTAYADRYEVQLIKDGKVIRDYVTDYRDKDDNFDLYDENPVITEGEYFWRVRGLIGSDPITEWSEKSAGCSFSVKIPMRFCALGDSITHGGGSISVPPSTAVYNWETYCAYPVKNLGKSGDTVEQMLTRFDNEVLPFHPEVLFILAGVNDYRGDTLGWRSVSNLKAIKDRCEFFGIVPVFITPTPLNARLMRKVKFVESPPSDWKTHRKYICDWILAQEHHIDIYDSLSDWDGDLREDLSVDGLHPDAEGKRLIGQAVEDWISNYIGIVQTDI